MEDTADSADESPQSEDTLTSADESDNEETRRPVGPTKPAPWVRCDFCTGTICTRVIGRVSDKTRVRVAEAFRIEAALPELDMSRILDPDRFTASSVSIVWRWRTENATIEALVGVAGKADEAGDVEVGKLVDGVSDVWL
ncbi:hypothetical protein FPV67DRAFT_1450937 [Lyophyllum atratum]|nr:hypothetical protein FPV67DRAFT_1450937 [Lyophyllum atratum]